MSESIKVLIADDESIVRKGLKATVDWAGFGMEVVADAANGRKAWECFLEHRPQVVVTDIVMPEMDGIELTRKIREVSPATKILLLSCHRDFEYAQQGIQLGVSGYLLKTAFEDDELGRLLGGFRDELNAPAAPASLSPEAGEDRCKTLFCAWLYGAGQEFEEELRLRSHGPWSLLTQEYYVYLLQKNKGMEEIEAGLPPELQAVTMPCGRDRCYVWFPPHAKKELDAYIMSRIGIDPTLRWYKEEPRIGVEAWISAVRELHARAERDKNYGIHAESWPEPLRQAVHIVSQDLKHPWSVSDVADRVGLSRSHFSTVFKKVTGENFVEFIYRMRLKAARDLLAHTPMTQQDIAEHIGLIDGKYFSKWFKRAGGETPSEFRQKQKGEQQKTK
ncbi:response regulator [Paenibacillus sp. LHD-117]|uniref:response regulator n=1 Tax=Paenibacillus sp. LHD-117 TaxID=3071412 RepID=UPI0027DEF1B4|nr:response regulator [Paenibacillus sp. LHD-117]MDQ6419774.1 response regulator [Paenibacillus sp. LHD-117]